ncbi:MULTISPECIES: cytochrome c3 family protein [unclassified Paracoccus (in: a-proteobacteria)]|uniref:cytochrome c3 family protein n=1 Tax=unclassified Paracoccus (in: a-proteobacteria) TaxID=2688777 RepID=UPI0018A6CA3A|nr:MULTISPECIES: cytochrome c3 family protein [unclassified Paracoccus (in: a-proteobacteria)]UXU76519.1 cytochrome c family protein [Paracoccus sp. SMMA_5]UXU82414.1 cytochrome c family protein [Paracoccus sp. SMMA_5_TC]
MRFGHDDHLGLPCAGCHHEFVDATTGPPCLTCHVTDVKVSPLLREQFHQLCQSCHTETRTRGQASGPMRRCGDCHVPDTEF